MRKFVCTLSYELSEDSSSLGREVLQNELANLRYKDRLEERRLPRGTLWILRGAEPEQTADDLRDACAADLERAAAAVRAAGLGIQVLRAWIHVSAEGSHGLARREGVSPREQTPSCPPISSRGTSQPPPRTSSRPPGGK
jgi:hypothetical protein